MTGVIAVHERVFYGEFIVKEGMNLTRKNGQVCLGNDTTKKLLIYVTLINDSSFTAHQ